MPKLYKYVIKKLNEELYWNHGSWVKKNKADFFEQSAVDDDREYIHLHRMTFNFARVKQDGSLEIIR